VVKTKAEDRAEVGFRHRYFAVEDPQVRAHFVEVVREVEAMA
jgi:hypothetical protein